MQPSGAASNAIVRGLMGVFLFLAVLGGGVTERRACAQVSAEESVQKMQAADGLEVSLWAAEPLVVNPTNMEVDSRGRVWVTEGLNYRYTLHRDQPYFEDADKIKILEDTDGDGRADKVTVFADKIFPVPMGIAVEEKWSREGKYEGCKVYVGNSPDLLVFEDTDGDDKADKRYPLLSGFGGVDHDHGVHGMVFGPDGKLYFTQGDNTSKDKPGYMFEVKDASGRVVANNQLATTLRANRDGSQFEIIADRQRNNYETSLNSFGNIFTSDNDDDGNRGCRVIWVMDGGTYGYRTPGSPRHWGEEVPGNVPKLVGTGNGSPSGIMVYEGTLLPDDFQGAVLEADAGTRQINHFPITRQGAAFRTVGGKVLVRSDDPWFRPIDMAAAPDGSVLVADWYDGGVGGHAFRDQTTGRIYRVTAAGEKPGVSPKYDFGSVAGLISALGSPNIAARDVAWRLLVARGAEAAGAVKSVFDGKESRVEDRARALWVLGSIEGEGGAALAALKDADPRIREQALRMLGRDVREVGEVSYERPEAKVAPAAQGHLEALMEMAADPDAGVRRELILALRNVPTEQAGGAIRRLAATWDGQDRWYLEALGLALRGRESSYLAGLFDGSLYGELDLAAAGKSGKVALPPYFPVDRNEAFLSVGEELPPANAISRTLGLMWQVHRSEVLPLLTKVMPALVAPELRQAAGDVIRQISDPAGASAVAGVVLDSSEPSRAREALVTLAGKLEGPWKSARGEQGVVAAIEKGLGQPLLRSAAIETAAATEDQRYVPAITAALEDEGETPEVRSAAVEAIGRIKPPGASQVMDRLIARAIEEHGSNPLAEAAVRTLPRLGGGGVLDRLVEILAGGEAPLGLRRQAFRSLLEQGGGGQRIIELAKEGRFPEELRNDAAILMNSSTTLDRQVRNQAAEVFPLPQTSAGKPLPPFFELVRQEGDAKKGGEVFFRATKSVQAGSAMACGACHRVQGKGEWVGPDLSTIGTKYGKDELLRSVLSPSAAIGYNYRSMNVATSDGRVISGLPIEETAERLVLKTADGRRESIRKSDIEEQQYSDVSLMPEGLAQTMGESDLVDLVAFLTTLRRPVSIVGQFQAIGPVKEVGGKLAIEGAEGSELNLKNADGKTVSPRRVTADAEGRVETTLLTAVEADEAVYLTSPVFSPVSQEGELVIEAAEETRVWLGGQEVKVAANDGESGTRRVKVQLEEGSLMLVVRLAGKTDAGLVATFVTDVPLDFSGAKFTQAAAAR